MIDTMRAANALVSARSLLPEGTRTRTVAPMCASVQGTTVPAAAKDATFVDARAWSPPV